MKYKLISSSVMLATALAVSAKDYYVETPNTSLVIDVENGRCPEFIYYGSRLTENDKQCLLRPTGGRMALYPAYGLDTPNEAAFAVTHADGNMSTQLVATGVDENEGENVRTTVVHLKDAVYSLFVDVAYKAYKDVDVIETWTEIVNKEKGTVTMTTFASAMLPIRRGNVWLSHFYGAWANEAQLAEEPLMPGMKTIKNKDGVRNTHTAHSEVMFSLDGKAHEDKGDVIGAALCYSGNYRITIDTDETDYHYFSAGINEDNSHYYLAKGETFATPHLALAFSKDGLGGVSRTFHRWGRKYMLANADVERKILLNSWEGVYFNITQQGMEQMMDDIADMGGELFVMDDGWFGDKYPRKSDRTSLGDWTVDRTRLPEGIESLISKAKENGIEFGIWIEPEMANTRSELYEKHPDWILKAPGREPVVGRGGSQLVLDLANPEVQDFVFNVVDRLMTDYPQIDYIKWDANMSVMNHGSQYLKADRQSHLYIEYHKGLAEVCKRIRAKYPKLTMQACASGGGRVNWGLLPWFDEFWTSDNTDALQRVYMQWGTSYFFPAIAMACHISASPNHTVYRSTSLKYRIDVAMSGRLGMEIQPKNMTEKEKEFCRNAIADYKKIRRVVQFGDLYRLVSPFDKKGLASLMYVDENKEKAAFFWWKTESFHNGHLPRVKMAGLNPERVYKVTELDRVDNVPLAFEGKAFTGKYLMDVGLEIPSRHSLSGSDRTDWSSRVLMLEAR